MDVYLVGGTSEYVKRYSYRWLRTERLWVKNPQARFLTFFEIGCNEQQKPEYTNTPLWRNKIIYCKMMHIPLLRGNTNNEAFRGGAFSRGEIRVHLASETHVIEN